MPFFRGVEQAQLWAAARKARTPLMRSGTILGMNIKPQGLYLHFPEAELVLQQSETDFSYFTVPEMTLEIIFYPQGTYYPDPGYLYSLDYRDPKHPEAERGLCPHPHVFRNRSMCLREWDTPLSAAFKVGDVIQIARTTQLFLNHWNNTYYINKRQVPWSYQGNTYYSYFFPKRQGRTEPRPVRRS